MKIDILTIFRAMFKGPLTESLIGKAAEKKILKINIIDIRSFSKDKHKKVDDKSFGGGCGMVIKPEPLYDAIKSAGVKKKITLIRILMQSLMSFICLRRAKFLTIVL
jgi:tRNA (guanine37-N1)-methyltransferase